MSYKYVIIYRGEGREKSASIKYTDSPNTIKAEYKGHMHLFDRSLDAILPAVYYCLCLPKDENEVLKTVTEEFDVQLDVFHHIEFYPSALVRDITVVDSTLIIYTDDCQRETVNYLMEQKAQVGAVALSSLNRNSLKETWSNLCRKRESTNCLFSELFNDFDFEQIKDFSKPYNVDSCIYNMSLVYRTLEIKKSNSFQSKNIVVVLPGIPSKQIKYGGRKETLPKPEGLAIRLMALHCALAKNAQLIEYCFEVSDLFSLLNQLEINCKQQTNNSYVIRTLHKLGEELAEKMDNEQLDTIRNAEHISVFSDFPIGIGMFSDGDAPLHTYKKITYHPLTPLTRAFQKEFGKHPIYCLSKCKIIFAECVPNTDNNYSIRKESELLVNAMRNCDHVEVIYKEISSISSLESLLAKNTDATILYISAHGNYSREGNYSCLEIGGEMWLAEECKVKMPSVIILSACHTNPRGNGCVNVSDSLMQLGCVAVLGTLVPISASRNRLLVSRLFEEISNAISSAKRNNTIMDCWNRVVKTNLILEMAEESRAFKEWINGTNNKGDNRYEELITKCDGNLHSGSVYKDICNILLDMLSEEEMDGQFSELIDSEKYFPECAFYQWVGYPEHIYL